jgi:hypothetical protein
MEWMKKDDYKYIEEYSAISPIEAAPEAALEEAAPEEAALEEAAPEEAAAEEAALEEAAPEEAAAEEAAPEEAAPEEAAPEEAAPEEQGPIPSSDIPILASLFGGQFFFIPSDSVTDIINLFDLDNDTIEAFGQTLGEEITDYEAAKYMSGEIKYSIYQLIFSPNNPIAPKPLIVKLPSPSNANEIADVVVIVKLPDGRIGLVSSDTIPRPIPFMNLKNPIKVAIKRIPFMVLDS